MLRLTEIKLPLGHPEEALRAAILQRLGIDTQDLLDFTVYKRSYDARQRRAILLIYTVDVKLADAAAASVAKRSIPHVGPTPDMRYRFVAQAPSGSA